LKEISLNELKTDNIPIATRASSQDNVKICCSLPPQRQQANQS